MLAEDELRDAVLLIFANKQVCKGRLNVKSQNGFNDDTRSLILQ